METEPKINATTPSSEKSGVTFFQLSPWGDFHFQRLFDFLKTRDFAKSYAGTYWGADHGLSRREMINIAEVSIVSEVGILNKMGYAEAVHSAMLFDYAMHNQEVV